MIKIPLKRAIIRLPAKRHLNGVCWRSDDGLTLNSGPVPLRFFRRSGPVLLRKPIFVIVQGEGSGPPVSPSGSAHASQEMISHVGTFPGLNQY